MMEDVQRAFFDENGFLLVKGFASRQECKGMIDRMQDMIDRWDEKTEKVPIFVTDEDQEKVQGSSDYFLDSSDRIHFFLEKGVTDADGHLLSTVAKNRALNK